MDRSTPIKLVAQTRTQDKYGVWRESRTERDVFAQVDNVTRAEFYEAGRNGLNPEFRMRVFFADYEGESELIYNGNRYAIYRTYQTRTDELELYVERKGGTNGKGND